MTTLAAYLRCSTSEQTVEPQRLELRRWLAYAHADLDYDADVREYIDEGVSGADWKRNKRVARPAYDQLVLDLARGGVEALILAKLDRLSRVTRRILDVADLCAANDVRLVALDLAVDTATPAGRLVLTVMAAMAEWERARIRERTRAGLAAAREAGVRPGPDPMELDLDTARKLLAEGRSRRSVAATLRVAPSTLKRHLERPSGAEPAGGPDGPP